MAANRQQGSYLALLILGFTLFAAGLVTWTSEHPVTGIVLALAGLGSMVQALVGFYRIKRLEFSE